MNTVANSTLPILGQVHPWNKMEWKEKTKTKLVLMLGYIEMTLTTFSAIFWLNFPVVSSGNYFINFIFFILLSKQTHKNFTHPQIISKRKSERYFFWLINRSIRFPFHLSRTNGYNIETKSQISHMIGINRFIFDFHWMLEAFVKKRNTRFLFGSKNRFEIRYTELTVCMYKPERKTNKLSPNINIIDKSCGHTNITANLYWQ